MTQQTLLPASRVDRASGPISFLFDGVPVRVVVRDSEPWFVASDVCDALDVGNASMAVSRLDDDEKGISIVDTLGGSQQSVVINESGLYSLTLTSRKPKAKRFKKWVTSEVLPSIRKTGRYIAPGASGDIFPVAAQQQDPRAALLAALRASGAMSVDAADRAGFMLLGLRPPRQRAAAFADVEARPLPVQLELAPQPARKTRATAAPAPKPAAPPLPMLRLVSEYALMNVGDLDRFVLHEVAEYVSGGLPELHRAMLARGFINEFDAPTKKAAGLVARKSHRGHHWYVRKLLRACGAIK